MTSGSHQSSLEPFMHPGLGLPREKPLLAFFQNVMDPLGEIFIGSWRRELEKDLK